ncbi:hypothetical protein ACQHIH_21450 (plasmid) [Xanthomonas sontii]|uniref:hypothetical protein n=1 Tax=Xanthomonas sontii TaxID=2650745 RepID=UPI003F82CB54
MPRNTESQGRVGEDALDVSPALAALASELRGRLSGKAIAVLVHARFAPAGWERQSFDNPILDELVREGLLRFGDARSGYERVKDGWVKPTSAGVIARAALVATGPEAERVASGARACSECRHLHTHLLCPQCVQQVTAEVEDAARSRDFERTHELLSGLEDCAVAVPDGWHEKPLLRFTGAYDEGDSSVGIGAQSGWVLAEDQAGTVLGDWLASNTEATPRG